MNFNYYFQKGPGVLTALFIFFFMLQTAAFSEETEALLPEGLLSKLDIEASASLDFYSQYIWRGFTLDSDPVIQPGFSLSAKGFTCGFWSSWDADSSDDLNSDEVDYIFDYTKDFENISLSLGHTYYDFPAVNSYSREFYAGVSLPKVMFEPSLTVYHDYGDEKNGGGDGNYVSLGFSKSFELFESPKITFDTGLRLGYNHELFIDGDGGDILIKSGLTVPLTENLTFLPTAAYAVPFGALEDSDDGNQDDEFYAGFSLAYSL